MIESSRREFARMRAGYARLLETHPFDSYAEARQTLMRPLLELWKAAYEKSCPRDVYLELLEYRGCAFLHDSACTVSDDAVCRVVAALTTSQELLSFEDLLGRAIAERERGVTPATLELIDNTLSALLDGAPRRQAEALRRAMACSIQLHHQSVLELISRFVDDVQYWSPRPRNLWIRRVWAILGKRIAGLGEQAPRLPVLAGRKLPADLLQPLIDMARLAEEKLSPAARLDLAADLAGNITAAYKEFKKAFAAGPSDELVARIRSDLLPLTRGRHPRPRAWARARYQMRRDGQTDVGHFIAHASGGPPDINFFHQERRLNRGWSEEGRRYRRIERYPAEHPGTFYFSRAIYEAESSIPRYLELGVLLQREEARQIANEIGEDEHLSFCFPRKLVGGLSLAWWLGVFDNQPAGDP